MATNVHIRTHIPWDVTYSDDDGASWSHWIGLNHSVLFKAIKPDPIPTLKNGKGGYEYPTDYVSYYFAAHGSAGEPQQRMGWHTDRYRTKWPLPPVTSNYVGPYGGNIEYYGCSGITPAVSSKTSSSVRGRLINAIKSQSWNAGQSLVEAPSTVKEMERTVKSVNKHVKVTNKFGQKAKSKYSGKTLKQLRKIPGAAAAGYLTALFSIKPLMNDAFQLMSTLDGQISTGRLVATIDEKDGSFGPPAGNFMNTEYSGEFIRGQKESATLGLTNPTAFTAWRYGLTNPLSLGWDVITLSFVLDWFTHIGSFLDGLQQPLGTVYLHGYSSKYLSMKCQLKCHMYYPGSAKGRLVVDDPMVLNIRQSAFRREQLYGFIPPLPYVDLGLNVNQTVTAIALMVAGR